MIAKSLALAAAATLGLSAIPVSAQDAAPVDPDLRCAAWAFVASAQEQNEGKQRALGFMMSYFVGRYEAHTGGDFETQIKPDTITTLLGNVEEANATCGKRAQEFGSRLNQTVQHMQPAPPSNSQAGDGR